MIKTLTISLMLIFFGSYLASQIQTQSGDITVTDVRFTGEAGQNMSGLLYLPNTATAESPQPAILAVHGYINTRETQSGFAIEYARRGFVVLALDQTGHGYSDAPAFSHGFGGPDGLKYLASLPQVDAGRIGLEGHSMGGWTILMAAAAMPDAYAVMVLVGSSTGTLGAPEGNSHFPKNLLLVFSQYDEFSEFMWDAKMPSDIVNTDKLKGLFGTDQAVKVGQLYGDINQGSARKLEMPFVTHPGDHLSTEVIGQAVDWMQTQLKPESPLPKDNQQWVWKEVGTLMALTGIVLILFPLTAFLLRQPIFLPLNSPVQAIKSLSSPGSSWKISAALTASIPLLTFFPAQTLGGVILQPNGIFSQAITNGIVLWMMVNGALSLLGYRFWLRTNPSKDTNPTSSLSEMGLSLILAVLVVSVLYAIALLINSLFTTDFRFWVVALKLMSTVQIGQFMIYLPFFTLFFVSLSLVLHRQLSLPEVTPTRAMVINCFILTVGFVVLMIVQYAPLLMGGAMTIASQPLLTIIAIQFIPLMVMIGAISTWVYYRSGSLYPGAFINGLLVTWYVVAGQATQAIPFAL